MMRKIYFLVLIVLSFPFILASCNDDEELNSSPTIIAQTFTIEENLEVGSNIGSVEANDADGNELYYSILGGNDLGAFTINSTSGELTVAKTEPLDFEVNPEFRLNIAVTDKESISNALITIILQDVDETVNGQLSFEGENYQIVDGLIFDYGSYAPKFGEEESHYLYDFILVDKELKLVTEDGETFYDADEIGMFIYAELISNGTDSFNPGRFEYVEDDFLAEDLEGKSYFSYLDISNDIENENIIYSAIGGEVIVTENGNLNYTIVYDVVLQKYFYNVVIDEYEPQGSSFKFNFEYSQTFKYEDERD